MWGHLPGGVAALPLPPSTAATTYQPPIILQTTDWISSIQRCFQVRARGCPRGGQGGRGRGWGGARVPRSAARQAAVHAPPSPPCSGRSASSRRRLTPGRRRRSCRPPCSSSSSSSSSRRRPGSSSSGSRRAVRPTAAWPALTQRQRWCRQAAAAAAAAGEAAASRPPWTCPSEGSRAGPLCRLRRLAPPCPWPAHQQPATPAATHDPARASRPPFHQLLPLPRRCSRWRRRATCCRPILMNAPLPLAKGPAQPALRLGRRAAAHSFRPEIPLAPVYPSLPTSPLYCATPRRCLIIESLRFFLFQAAAPSPVPAPLLTSASSTPGLHPG